MRNPKSLPYDFVSSVALAILEFINFKGPSGVRKLRDEGHFNPTTVAPILEELVKLGLLWRESKPKARPGNPLPYHITLDGVRVAVPNWPRMTTSERLTSTHRDNYADLIVDMVLHEQPTDLLASQEQSTIPQLLVPQKPPHGIDPELYGSVFEMARSTDRVNRGAPVWASWLVLCAHDLELYRKIFLTPIHALEAGFARAAIPEEPGVTKSAIWLILFILGVTLIGVGQWLGMIPLVIDGMMYYFDYVRNPRQRNRYLGVGL